MHNKAKRIVAVLLSVVMVLSVFGGMTFTASAASSGTCGANGGNLTWTLDNGVLTISGSGDMADYSNVSTTTTAPWGGSAASITGIVVESGVTSIGSYAFYYLQSVRSASIADTVQTIKASAFADTFALTSITIPGSVTTIGGNAFYYSGAKTVTIEEGVQSLGISCFAAAEVETLTMPKSLQTFGASAFGNCSHLISVYYNGTVADWSAITFASSSSTPLYYAKDLYLEGTLFEGELVIPSNMTSIDTAQFCGFKCTSIVFPENLTQIGQYAFSNCTSLTAAEIPDGVTSIGNYAFAGCESLTHIHIPSSVTTIGSNVFQYITGLEYICSDAFGNTAQTYARNNDIAFRCCTPGASVTVTFDSAGGFAVPFQNIPVNGTATEPMSTKTGHAFLGWTLNGEVYDFSTPVTEDITLKAAWVEGGVESAQSFDSSSLPGGWTKTTNTWSFTNNRVVKSKTVTPHSGTRYAYHSNSNPSYLISPSMDLSGKSVVKLTFWYQNRYNGTKHDDLAVYYQVDNERVEVFRTDAEHPTWTSASVALPQGALQNNVQIVFYADVHSGYGVFLDDFEVLVDPVHDLTYTASGNVLTAACAKSTCTLEGSAITLTLNAPAKTNIEDDLSADATLTGLGLFNLHTGLSVSADSIEYYSGDTKLDTAPTDSGSYTAALTMTVGGTDYTITKDYAMQGPHTHTTADDTTITFEPWESANSLPTSGSYYLTQNVTVAATTTLTGNLNLCLAGKTVTMTGSGSVLNVPTGKTLNLFDETGDLGVITGGDAVNGGGIYVAGTLNMYGGTISGNAATSAGASGAGIYACYGEVNLYGGAISGNTAKSYAGGVNLYSSTLNMYGGSISDNTSNGYGGGLYADESTINMYDG